MKAYNEVRPQEDPKNTLYFAHVFFADHVLSTAWTVFFAVVWWVYTPHDGRREIASEAQKQIMEAGGGVRNMTQTERVQAATALWNEEKGTAAAVISLGWLSKVHTPGSRFWTNLTSKNRFTLLYSSTLTLYTCAKARTARFRSLAQCLHRTLLCRRYQTRRKMRKTSTSSLSAAHQRPDTGTPQAGPLSRASLISSARRVALDAARKARASRRR